MKLGPILAALSPGLAMTGLLGHGAQDTAGGVLGGMSPLAMLLMHKKKHGQGATPDAAAAPNPAAPVAPPAAPQLSPIAAGLANGGGMPPQPQMQPPHMMPPQMQPPHQIAPQGAPAAPPRSLFHGMDRDKLAAMFNAMSGAYSGYGGLGGPQRPF